MKKMSCILIILFVNSSLLAIKVPSTKKGASMGFPDVCRTASPDTNPEIPLPYFFAAPSEIKQKSEKMTPAQKQTLAKQRPTRQRRQELLQWLDFIKNVADASENSVLNSRSPQKQIDEVKTALAEVRKLLQEGEQAVRNSGNNGDMYKKFFAVHKKLLMLEYPDLIRSK